MKMVKGLSILTPNINNLPFQVRWDKNRTFKYENINKKIKQFIDCLKNQNQVGKKPLCQIYGHYRYSLGI